MKLGQIIKEEREKQNITQTALAESVGITQGGLSQIESGKRIPFHTILDLLSILEYNGEIDYNGLVLKITPKKGKTNASESE